MEQEELKMPICSQVKNEQEELKMPICFMDFPSSRPYPIPVHAIIFYGLTWADWVVPENTTGSIYDSNSKDRKLKNIALTCLRQTFLQNVKFQIWDDVECLQGVDGVSSQLLQKPATSPERTMSTC